MHLLYLDDSGAASNANEQYVVLGGVSVFEAQSYWITRKLDELAETIDPGNPHGVEFHASATYARRSQPWKSLSQDEARGTIKAVLGVLANAYNTARVFACVVHKNSFPNRDPMEIAFEDLCSRFDRYLQRLRGPRWTGENRPLIDTSKPATTGVATETGKFYFVASSGRKSVWTFVRQLRGPHFRTWAWCKRRSRSAVTAAVSLRSLPQSSTGRLDVRSVDARS